MRKYSSISTLALSAMMSTTLLLGGCGNKDEVQQSAKQAAKQAVSIKSRNVSEAEASKALKLMGLDVSGTEHLSWASRSGDKGNYTFKVLTPTGENADEGSIQELVLRGVHMEGDAPAFDQISVKGIKTVDHDTVVTVKSLSLSNPTIALSSAIGLALGGDDDAFENIEGDFGFSAMALDALNVKSDDAHLTLDSVEIAKGKNGKGTFNLNDFKLDTNEDDRAINIRLGSINVKGANIEKYKGILSEVLKGSKNGRGFNEEAFSKVMGSMNPYDPDFESFSIKKLNVDAEGIIINLESMSGKAHKKGSKTIMSQTMSPLTITPPKDVSKASTGVKSFVKSLETLGYKKLEFTMEQHSVLDEAKDSMVVTDSYFALKDGFKLSFDYDMVGYKAYLQNAMNQSIGKKPDDVMNMLNALKINKARIALRDDSIVARGFKLAAEQQGGTPEALKSQAKMGLAFLPMMAQDEAQQKIAADLGKALGEWLDDSGTLVFSLNPKTPIQLGALAKGAKNGDFDAATLGLSITRE
ncbi:MAG: hypothetical protein COA43_03975 [Robiginitomaculum sp.]|nr:MAG: hypothetical protein COA43_03975 [Robiginitomaculum sp.]